MRTITHEEFEARIREYLAENFPGATSVTYDAASVLAEDEYVED